MCRRGLASAIGGATRSLAVECRALFVQHCRRALVDGDALSSSLVASIVDVVRPPSPTQALPAQLSIAFFPRLATCLIVQMLQTCTLDDRLLASCNSAAIVNIIVVVIAVARRAANGVGRRRLATADARSSRAAQRRRCRLVAHRRRQVVVNAVANNPSRLATGNVCVSFLSRVSFFVSTRRQLLSVLQCGVPKLRAIVADELACGVDVDW